MTSTLILLRHGNSTWNQKNLFTGWVDVPLSEQGVAEAKRAGELLAESGLKPDILYTSVLTRAIQTANLALDVADRLWIPVKRSWRLNERHYGALQGNDKAQTLAEVRRGAVHALAPQLRRAAAAARRRRRVVAVRRRALRGRCRTPTSRAPRASSSSSTACCRTGSRTSPPISRPARPCSSRPTATRCARSSSTSTASRDDEIAELNIPTGIPLVYELDDDFRPTGPVALPRPGGRRRRRRRGRRAGQEVARA